MGGGGRSLSRWCWWECGAVRGGHCLDGAGGNVGQWMVGGGGHCLDVAGGNVGRWWEVTV